MPTTTQQPARSMPARNTARPPVLHHVNLKTTRLKDMIDWYADVVGMEVTFQNPGVAFASNDAANHRLALIASPLLRDDPDRRVHTGMHHLAFEFASVDDLLDCWRRLHDARGLEPHMSLDHGMTLSFYYVDPDGNSVELQADWFGDWNASKSWMHDAAEFAANPIGAFVDPAKMFAARAAGATTDELHRRAYAGEFPPSTPPDPRVDLPAP